MEFNAQTIIGLLLTLAAGGTLSWPVISPYLPWKNKSTTDPPFSAVQELRSYFASVGNAEGEAAAILCGKELFTVIPERPK